MQWQDPGTREGQDVTEQGISVVIPCRNEAAAIAMVVRGVGDVLAGREHEVVVVDDGSTDATGVRAAKAGARVVRLSPNKGKGVSLRAGIEAAAHDVLVLLDGDGQDDPADIPALLDALKPDVDLVIGSRFMGTLHPGAIHPLNRLANRAFSTLISLLFRRRITDSQAGFRALRRSAWLRLPLSAREYDVETDTLLKAIKAGWNVVEIPVSRHPRAGGRTAFRRIRHGTLILWTILRERVPA